MKPLVKRLVLHPGPVTSKADGERHFVSASNLIHLYHILPTDIVAVFNGRNKMPMDIFHAEGWIDLYPLKDGNYYDIHELDDKQIKNIKFPKP